MSSDPVAMDRALIQLLGLRAENCPILQAARKRNMAAAQAENVQISGLETGAFQATPFIPPERLNPVPFNPFRFFSSIFKRISIAFSS